jgi:hypothetical protein
MSANILAAAPSLRSALAGFEPGLFSGPDSARLAEVPALTEKACAAARLLAAARAVNGGAHQDRGFRHGPAWLAQQSGTTATQARQALETAGRLQDCPDTRAALLAGELSLAQAQDISEAQAETPGAEHALLPLARQGDLSSLRQQAREHRQAHTPVEDLHRQQQRARSFRHWRDRLGMVCFAGALPPEAGLPFVRRIELAAQRARRAARQDDDAAPRERFEAHAADALAALIAGPDTPRRPDRAELVIVCDLSAWRCGHTHPGEACHLIDGGPIPVPMAQDLAQDDGSLAVVLDDGSYTSGSRV